LLRVTRYTLAIFIIIFTILLLSTSRSSLLEIFRIEFDLQFLNIRTIAYKLLTKDFYTFFFLYIIDLNKRVRILSKFNKFRFFDVAISLVVITLSKKSRN